MTGRRELIYSCFAGVVGTIALWAGQSYLEKKDREDELLAERAPRPVSARTTTMWVGPSDEWTFVVIEAGDGRLSVTTTPTRSVGPVGEWSRELTDEEKQFLLNGGKLQ